MAQKSSKQRAEEAVLDLKGKLRQLNKTLADKGAVVAENAPLVATIKAVEGLKVGKEIKLIVFKSQQFYTWTDSEFPEMKVKDGLLKADLKYLFARNPNLKALPRIDGLETASDLFRYAWVCPSLADASLPDLNEATTVEGMFESCSSLTSATIGAMPKATNVSGVFFGCSALKSVTLDFSGGEITDASYLFGGCAKLLTVTGTLDCSSTTQVGDTFSGCTSLEEVRIKGLKASLDLSACVNLSMESIRYLVENAQTVTGKSINLSRTLLDANEEALGDIGETASDKGWTINYK